MPIRIYALAKDLKIDSKELVEFCNKAGIPGKGSALDLEREMRFAAAVVAPVAGVAGAVVDHGKPGGSKGCAQQLAYFLCDWS